MKKTTIKGKKITDLSDAMGKKPKPRLQKRSLRHEFTSEEIIELARQLATNTKEIEQLKADKKATVSDFDNKIKVIIPYFPTICRRRIFPKI